MTDALPPLPALPPHEVEEWSESFITLRGEGWKKETVEKYAVDYARAAIAQAQSCVPAGVMDSRIADPFTYIIQHLNSDPYNLTKDECVELIKKLRFLYASPQPQPVHDEIAYKEAVNLATALFKKHFAHEEHYASGRVVWGPCDTTAGVISQIDNMVCGLIQPQPVQPSNSPCACRPGMFCNNSSKCAADIRAAQAKPEQAAQPIAWHTEDHLTDRSATTYDKDMVYRWRSKGWPITPLYAEPPPPKD